MTLGEAIAGLEERDDDATIYAAKPWTSDSRAVVAAEPADGSLPVEAAGLEYFLEVDIALDAARVGDAGTRFDRVLHYAEHDAYLFDE